MKPFLPAVILALSAQLYSQSPGIDSIATLNPVKVKKVEINESDFTKIYVPTSFAEKELKDTSQFQKLRSTRIIAVDLVYTKYRQSETFAQIELNKARLAELIKLFPDAFNDDVYWNLVEQTEADDNDEAVECFHGFIFTIQPKLMLTVGTTEMEYLDSVMERLEEKIKPDCASQIEKLTIEKKLPSAPQFGTGTLELKNYLQSSIKFPDGKRKRKISGSVSAQIYVSEEGKVDSFTTSRRYLKASFENQVIDVLNELPDFNPSVFQTGNISYTYPVKITFNAKNRRKERVTVTPLKPKMTPHCSDSSVIITGIDYSDIFVSDTTVISVFNRHDEWNNMLVICDFTGSMAPYTAQVLVWFHLMLSSNDNQVKYFCFFNDGNAKADSQKKIGSTGGIYFSDANTIQGVRDLARTTMEHGNGGDVPENNVEALLEAMKKYPDAGDIIMIADNFATPRDLILLSKIKRPIKIILCGTQYGINVDYLNFARQTGSTIHTMNEDITNLAAMKEGDRIMIDGVEYEIRNGEFVRVVVR